jgi:hypothetical protein
MSVSVSFISGNNLEVITFDSASSVRPVFESEIAEHPIEKGSDASDNARDKPEVLTVEGVFTDYPLSINGGGIGAPHEKGRAADILKELLYLKNKGVRFKVSTKLRQYSDMMIQSIAPNSDKLKGAMRLTVVFRRVQIVASETVNVTVAANRGGQKHVEKGEHTGTEVKADEGLKSNLARILDSDVTKKALDFAKAGLTP